MSTTSIEAHHQKWDALPAFPAWPYVMTDDDVEAWSDVLYIRGLIDAIGVVCSHTGARPTSLPFGQIHQDTIAATGVDNSLFFPTANPWPADEAAELLATWKPVAA